MPRHCLKSKLLVVSLFFFLASSSHVFSEQPHDAEEKASMEGKPWYVFTWEKDMLVFSDTDYRNGISFPIGKKKAVHTGYELVDSSAVFQGQYKLSINLPSKGSGEWDLYGISVDASELNNLAIQQPERADKLINAYADYANENALVAVPEGYSPLTQVLTT